jgi:tetratricopeptide (TPR) repeat protein
MTGRDERARHRRLTDAVAAALDAPPDERERALRSACDGDEALLLEAAALLRAHETDDGFLAVDGAIAGARRDAGNAVTQPELPEIPGYTVRGVLASGGMGSVFDAEQASPRRRVAIKTLRALDGSRDARARFRFESEVLGRLRHPGIAQIYEAGTFRDDGADADRPFFAMEYIEDAAPITAHADRAGADHAARADLFIGVCAAVHYGHQRGIVHRDLKPGNILVDGAGAVKVIDYGVARATETATIDAGVRTLAGGVVGTLRYMSPEQLSGDPDAVDARSDVYALGVVLFELMTGRPPYEIDRTSIVSAARTIADTEPARPSAIDRSLRGDLEAVLIRALEKDPARRYPSAAALGDDLRRWLEDRPVEARPVSAVYQLRKLAARHRGATAAGVVAAASLVGGTVFSTAMAVRATRSAAAEREQRESLGDLNGYLSGILTSVTPEATRSQEVTVREMLADAVSRIDDELGDRPELAATVRHRIGASYLAVGAPAEAERALAAAYESRAARLGDHPDTLASLVRLSAAWLELGRAPDARDGFARALAMAERLGESGRTPIAIEAKGGLGIAEATSGDLEAGVGLLREAIDDARAAGVSDEQRLTLMNTLASVRARTGAYEDALTLLRDTAAERTRLLGADHPSTLTSVNNLGTTLTDARRYDDAEAVLRPNLADRVRVLGPDHPETISSMNNLAIVLSRLERDEEAEALTRAVLGLRIEALGREHPGTISAAMNLYTHLVRTDRDAEADALLGEWVPIAERTLEPAHPIRLFVLSKFVLSGLRNGAHASAAGAARRALDALDGTVDDSYWEVGRFRAMLGAALSLQGALDEGGDLLERGVAGLSAARGPDHPWTRWARARLDEHLARVEAAGGASGDPSGP